jgi:type I restriction enzyme, S subunit
MTSTTRTLGEICDEVGGIIRTGPFGSQLHESDYREEGTPVIMPKDIVEGKVSADSIARIGDEDVERLSQHVLKRGEIVYGRRGDIGRRALITEKEAGWLCGTGCLRVSLGETVLDPQFLFYYLGQPRVIKAIANQAIGATLPNLNTSIIRSIPITYPLLPTQRRIASILSAYDDLIENNTRRIKILEQMAQAIYREWFEEFRAPDVKLRKVTSEEQKVTRKDRFPVGWELKTFGDVALNFDSKRKPLSSMVRANMKGEYPYYGAAKVFDYINDYIFDGRYLLVAEDGSVITPDRKPVLQIATGKFWANNHTHIIQGKPPVSTNYLYLALSDFDIAGYVTGAAQPKITQANLNRIPIVVADEQLLDKFNHTVDDLLEQVDVLGRKNANLRQTRDLLLPRLVGGEIIVGP